MYWENEEKGGQIRQTNNIVQFNQETQLITTDYKGNKRVARRPITTAKKPDSIRRERFQRLTHTEISLRYWRESPTGATCKLLTAEKVEKRRRRRSNPGGQLCLLVLDALPVLRRLI